MKQSSESSLSRRTALAGAGAVGAVAAVAAVLPGTGAQTEVQAQAPSDAAASDSAKYRLTEHIKRYYSTART